MARPRGTARSRRHAPPLDKPGRSGLLALRRFHDGLQTPTLVRLLVRTKKEEISTGQKTINLFFHHHQAAARPPAERTRHARISTTTQKEIAFGNPKFPNAISFFGRTWQQTSRERIPNWGHTAEATSPPRLHQNSSWKPFDFSSAYFSALKLKRLASLRCEGLAVSPVSSSMPRRLILL